MKEIANVMMKCLAAAIGGGAVGQVNISMRGLYALSAHHDMAHLVASVLESEGLLGEDEVSELFRRQQILAIFREANQSEEMARVCETFEREGIDYLPLKGAVIRSLYPEPWMRTGCDVDILVRPEQLDHAADAICAQLGYKRDARNSHDLGLFSENGVQVELHFDTIEEGCAAEAASILRDVWSYARPMEGTAHGYRMTDDMFYFYHIAHMAKHFEHGGCGVKPFLDLWLLRHRVQFDGQARQTLLERGGLAVFAEASERLSEVWFSGGESDELCQKMSEYLLLAGTYGTSETKVAVGQAKRGGRLKNLLARIWLPYDILRKHYPSLDGKRWLLPLYQFRRWFRLLKEGGIKRTAKEFQTNASVSGETTKSIADLFAQLKL